ncbi:MAG: prolyl aminopeptidase [Planctomycetota bacterium]|nr:MAG: prolyl aminopeptidase [Planctomycetota bacterium]
MTELLKLFPAIDPFKSYYFPVDNEHTLYIEECGNPQGKPVLFIHGGPGGGISVDFRRFWDPKTYHIILFEQRGCGRSTPHASLNNNTTWDLVNDIEKIRKDLNIKKWQVFGGSWGSTLALAYAIKHPSNVSELILRGIFTLRKKELHWFYQEGASYIYPDIWEPFINHIPEDERGDLMAAYYKRLTSSNEKEQLEAAKIWSIWEGSTSKLFIDENLIKKTGGDKFALAFARIECHYFVNKGFFEYDNYLIDQAKTLKDIPSTIIQGRYDIVCPMRTAWDIHKSWPEAEFKIVQDAGHNIFETGITHELIAATEKYK